MLMGIAFALGACFIWGLIFVVPQFMTGFSSLEVALGRHFCYGCISLLLFLKSRVSQNTLTKGFSFCSLSIWKKALVFSLIMNIIYYTFLVLSLRYATPAICALIVGISPIVITFWANFQQKEVSFKSLLAPVFFIFLGLVCVNLPHLDAPLDTTTTHISPAYLFGLFSAVVALLSWSWYVVANARFLKHHPEIQSGDWSTILGLATLFWVVVLSLAVGIFFADAKQVGKYFIYSEQLQSFVLGSLVLGVLCSWVGGFFWNKACYRLPVTLAGQLTIFETVFGLFFVYILEQKTPPLLECIGIFFMLVAIVWGIRFSSQQSFSHEIV